MKKKLIIAILITFLIFLGIYSSKKKGQEVPDTSVSEEQSNETVYLTIDFEDGKYIDYDTKIEEELTAYSILEKALLDKDLSIDTKKYDFGILVNAINGVENKNDMAWIYFVNGTAGDIAADQKELKPDDVVEWVYTEPK